MGLAEIRLMATWMVANMARFSQCMKWGGGTHNCCESPWSFHIGYAALKVHGLPLQTQLVWFIILLFFAALAALSFTLAQSQTSCECFEVTCVVLVLCFYLQNQKLTDAFSRGQSSRRLSMLLAAGRAPH